MRIATYDIGTTAVKGVLVSGRGEILSSVSEPVTTRFEGDKKEQEPEEWYQAFCRISRRFAEFSLPEPIDGIIMSGQMQDVIPIDAAGNPTGNAILYSDGRAGAEAEELFAGVGREYLEEVTGNHYDGSLSVPKIMWLKKNQADCFRQTAHVLISAKDYVIFKLTGKAVGDITACSTAGAMNIVQKEWDERILEAAGIPADMLPELYDPHQIVGFLTHRAAEETGFSEETKVYAGVGDAGAATLASGIACPGEYNINLGTSGWVAAISSAVSDTADGVFNLAALNDGLYINVVPFLNAGNVHKWVSGLFTPDDKETGIDYASIGMALEKGVAGSNGVVFLPYLNGERFPVMDTEVKGTFLGITASTRKADMIRSCLEGVAFSIRQGIESLKTAPHKISVIGGGARVELWNQILADVLNQKVYVYKNSEVLPALALSSAVLLAEGKIKSYSEFTDSLQDEECSTVYKPVPENVECYDRLFEQYIKIYPMVKEYYQK